MSRLAFPFRVAASGRSATVAEGGADHVRDMLELLILTIPGERIMRPELGSPVQQLLFGAGDGPVAIALQAALAATISQHLGNDLELKDLQVSFSETDAALTVVVDYWLRSTHKPGRLTVERRP